MSLRVHNVRSHARLRVAIWAISLWKVFAWVNSKVKREVVHSKWVKGVCQHVLWSLPLGHTVRFLRCTCLAFIGAYPLGGFVTWDSELRELQKWIKLHRSIFKQLFLLQGLFDSDLCDSKMEGIHLQDLLSVSKVLDQRKSN